MPVKISLAEAAKTLVINSSHGVLSTLSTDGGFPYGSVVDYLPLPGGDVIVLLSELAEHFRYLRANPKASVLVAPELIEEDPVPKPRVTLLGEAAPAGNETALIDDFIARHPEVETYIGYDHLRLVHLDVQAVRYITGMGRTGWLDPVEYRGCAPDPLGAESGWLTHTINELGANTLRQLAHNLAGVTWADQFQAVGIDRYGFDLVCAAGQRRRTVRLAFGSEITEGDGVRAAVNKLVTRAMRLRAVSR